VVSELVSGSILFNVIMERRNHFALLPDSEDLLATQKVVCTQDLDDTEKIVHTQDLEDTQIVEATQDLRKSVCVAQKVDSSIEDSQDDENLSEDDTLKGSGNPLKDLSNLPKKSTKSHILCDSDKPKSFGVCTEEIPDTQEIFPSQDNTPNLEEQDLTPEIGSANVSPSLKPSGKNLY